MGIFTVGVFSDADVHAVHTRACDEAIGIGGTSPSESYLRAGVLIDAARRSGADAVHPGYGFLSENAEFAAQVVAAGLAWVGPRPETIASMGDKLRAKEIMRQAGVPTLPSIAIRTEEDVQLAAATLTAPVIVKAAAGGGGKGMRLVLDMSDLPDAVRSCRGEARNAFGNDSVFVEPFLPRPRHIEVQILGDRYGQVVHLFERECSLQRRHQKVIEEAPAYGLPSTLRGELLEAAVAAGSALGYESAGTVEFVVGEDGSAAFLEVNTRIQVEHPVTEAVTGLDVVRLQLHVAQGLPLPMEQRDVICRGHAIEARIYAENPATGYLPAAGTVSDWRPSIGEGVRWDSGVESGIVISPLYDPMLAKVTAWGETRDEAALRLHRTLRCSHIHGPATNRAMLCAVLAEPDFLAGDTTTSFLEDHYPTDQSRSFPPNQGLLEDAAIVAVLAAAAARRGAPSIPSGWRNNRDLDQCVDFAGRAADLRVRYRAERDGTWWVGVDTQSFRVMWASDWVPGEIELTVDGRRFTAAFSAHQAGAEVVWEVTTPRGNVSLRELPRFPETKEAEVAGATRAPMHGTVTIVAVEPGQMVSRGDLLCCIEAMKMEHRLLAPYDGVVASVGVTEGSQVADNQILVVLDEVGAAVQATD
jgi:acetyl/propionyl-CoA carboxylase alpha subunit